MDHCEYCDLACPHGIIGVINYWSLSCCCIISNDGPHNKRENNVGKYLNRFLKNMVFKIGY